ncbi:MAG TPA: serpin family protein [Bacteroidota bacterium]|nr:serpin family protein [Bacteroidota bacterium]
MIGLIFVSLACKDNGTGPVPNPPNHTIAYLQQQTITQSNRFGFNLFNTVDRASPDSNLLVSPLSVSMALGMTLNGAGGATYDSMAHVLGFDALTNQEIDESYQAVMASLTSADPSVASTIANSIWIRQGFNVDTAFVSVNKTYFKADVTPLDFSNPSAATTINNWVSTATNGKIPAIVASPIPALIKMYLIDAVYFKGAWAAQFDSSKTANASFVLRNGTRAEVPMMFQEHRFPYYGDATLQIIDLPYGNGNYRMTIVLPASGTDIDAFIASMNPAEWAGWLGKMESDEVNLTLPRFTFRSDLMLVDALSAMGMGVAFTPYADFTRITSFPPLLISEVKHKTYIKVGEQGTEAAAVTSVGATATVVYIPPQGFVMDVNHPFLFAIREATSGTIMFIGKVIDPR